MSLSLSFLLIRQLIQAGEVQYQKKEKKSTRSDMQRFSQALNKIKDLKKKEEI